jgi:SAM-dependent methyltransferase
MSAFSEHPNLHPSSTEAAWLQLHAEACAPYRQAGRFAWHWARGKLAKDPVFQGMLQRGELPAQARVVDIGCGQGLIASLLLACQALQRRHAWPQGWPVAASATAYTGIELMSSDVKRGEAALSSVSNAAFQAQFVCADMREAAIPACDVVVILDVLHYVDHSAQVAVLTKVRDALAASRGRLLLRVGDAANTRGFAISQWVDRVVTRARGHGVPPTWGRSLADWAQVLRALGFSVKSIPQSKGTPFANVLLVADLVADLT